VRDLTEGQIGRIPIPGVRQLKAMAATFLDGMPAADLSRRIAELEERNAAMVEMLEEKKRGPGRPRKEEVAA
jgi:hypothetical protein